MKKLALLIGLFAFLIFMGTARATTYECDSCSDCYNKINAISSSGDTIQLNKSITAPPSAGCIKFNATGGGGADNKTFDCLGHTIDGNGSSYYGFTMEQNTMNDTIQNCIIKDMTSWGILDSGSNLDQFINITIQGCQKGFQMTYTGNATIRDSRIENSGSWGWRTTFTNNLSLYNNIFNESTYIEKVFDYDYPNYYNTTRRTATNIIGGSEIGGNYWAYPNGTGYSQTCDNADNDSFCDAPFVLNENNTDYLPLTTNWTFAPPSLNISFVSPTPTNNTIKSSGSFIANISSNGTISSCIITLDGGNSSMTIASGNLSASKANSGLSNGKHIYNVTCDGFNSETRTVWVSFGNCTSCSECTEMATNSDTGVTINLANNLTTNDDCITISKPITFDCLLHIIDGNNTGVIGILFTGGQGNLQNCTITKFTLGIYFAATWNNIIQNINVSYNTGQGIVHYGYGQGNSSFNNIIANNNDYGIYVSAVDDIFTNIEANNNTASGVYLTTGAYRSKLISSVTKNNGANGVVIIYFSDCSLQNVTSTNNVGAGLYISQSNVIVNDSHFENNQDSGIHSYYSGNNQFYNNFLNNTANAIFDFSSGSFWNTTIINVINIIGRNQIGGNYWAYPNGTGYSETCDNLNNDSFCDTSYNITDNDIDYIPLTTKYYTPPPPLIDNIGIFATVALLVMGAGVLLFLMDLLFSKEFDLKMIITGIIGAIIIIAIISVLL